MQFHFYKFQGTGNDFVIMDNRTITFPKGDHALVKAICDRRFGIGADGLMLLENIHGFDFKMVYYNSDGKESSMCGNGGRCIAAFAKSLGLATDKGNFLAIDGGHDFILNGNAVKLKMIDVLSVDRNENDFILFTGSPHYVLFRKNIDEINIDEEARKIRYNDTYKTEGINVNFVEEKNGKIYMRTYERGVEGETLSCGTGTVAVALSVAIKNKLNSGTVEILTPGGNLKVAFEKNDGKFTNVWLEGEAKMVFEGRINLNGQNL